MVAVHQSVNIYNRFFCLLLKYFWPVCFSLIVSSSDERKEILSFSRAKNSLVGFSIGINDDDMMITIRKEDRQDSTQQTCTHIYLIMASLFNSVRDIKKYTHTLAQPSE